MLNNNQIKSIHHGIPASDGDGVKLTRIIGTQQLPDLDPFLLLDHFGSDQANDYIGGFPAHPHRGFETVTYMLKGKMRHKDSAGNEGVIEDGGIQWMTAGKGIIHAEMPEQTAGILSGFQLWVNLPSHAKMTPPNYQENNAAEIPTESHDNGVYIKVIAGQTLKGTKGVIDNQFVNPNYWDIYMPKDSEFTDQINPQHNAFIYAYKGKVSVADEQTITRGQMAVLTAGKSLKVTAQQDSQMILVSGRPLNEPVERSGPFVMNTREQLQQAYADYQTGRLTE